MSEMVFIRLTTLGFRSLVLNSTKYYESGKTGKVYLTEQINKGLKKFKQDLKEYLPYYTFRFGYVGEGLDREIMVEVENFDKGFTVAEAEEIRGILNKPFENCMDKCCFIQLFSDKQKVTYKKI